MNWCRKNIQERWEKRFALQTQSEHDEGVLVLKSRYNDVWNWFSAAELGKAVTEYWSDWYTHSEKGQFISDPARPFQPDNPDDNHGITDVRPDLWTRVLNREGEEVFVPDLRKIGILGCRWIVSRKRTTNLFDLSSLWKKTVFRKLDEAIAEEGGVVPQISSIDDETNILVPDRPIIQDVQDDDIVLHRREPSEELEHPEFGRISKVYTR